MSKTLALRPRGARTDQNPLSEVPDGGLQVAQNVVIGKNHVIYSRRGINSKFDAFIASGTGDPLDPLSVEEYGGYFIAGAFDELDLNYYIVSNKIASPDWGQFRTYDFIDTTDKLLEPPGYIFNSSQIEAYYRFAKMHNNIYITTNKGVKKADSPDGSPNPSAPGRGFIIPAGLNQPYDVLSASMKFGSGIGGTGFLLDDSACAYRVVIGYRDSNNNLILSPPSGRVVVRNRPYVDDGANTVQLNVTANVLTVTLAGGFTFSPVMSTGDTFDLVYATDIKPATPPPPPWTVLAGATSTVVTANNTHANVANFKGNTFKFRTRPVTLSIKVPPYVTADHFLRVYRSPLSASANIEPSDELGLVYETGSLTPGGTLTFDDITPVVGEPLYTNQYQEGITQENSPPPLCNDMCSFRSRMWYANSTSRQSVEFTLLDASALNTAVDTIQINNLLFVADTVQNNSGHYLVVNSALNSPQQNTAATARNLVRAINEHTKNKLYIASYISGSQSTDIQGTILIQMVDNGVCVNNVDVNNYEKTKSFVITEYPNPGFFSPSLDGLTASVTLVSRSGSTATATTSAAHGFSVGDNVMMYFSPGPLNELSYPNGVRTIASVPTTTTFTYEDLISTSAAPSATAGRTALRTSVYSKETRNKNRLYYSKFSEPESVPALNYIEIGTESDQIVRIVPMRDALFIFKENEGVFRLSDVGDTPEIFDPTTHLIPIFQNTVARLDNQIICLTTNGFMAISTEGGAQVISTPNIRDLVQKIIIAYQNTYGSTLNKSLNACAYQSDNLYIFSYIDNFDEGVNYNVGAFKKLVFNTQSGEWTTWSNTSDIVIAAVINGEKNVEKLWFFASQDKDENPLNYVGRERKTASFSAFDLYDNDSLTVAISAVSGLTVTVASVTNLAVGDMLAFGSARAIVESIVDSTHVTTNVAWTGGAVTATIRKGIPITIQFNTATGGDPGVQKHFNGLSVFYRDAFFTKMKITISTDISPSMTDGLVSIYGYANAHWADAPWFYDRWGQAVHAKIVRGHIPRAKARCSEMDVRITHNRPMEMWSIEGMQLTFNEYAQEDKADI